MLPTQDKQTHAKQFILKAIHPTHSHSYHISFLFLSSLFLSTALFLCEAAEILNRREREEDSTCLREHGLFLSSVDLQTLEQLAIVRDEVKGIPAV